MAISRRPGRSRTVLIFLVLISLTFITLDFRGDGGGITGGLRHAMESFFSPVQSATSGIVEPLGNAISGVTGYGDLEKENQILRDQVADLESRAAVGDDIRKALSDALALQDLTFVGNIATVSARVVSIPISNFEQAIELDKGSKESIEVGMPVVTSAGLVGRVVEVSSGRSRVQLISDSTSAVGVLLPTSNERGVAEGEGVNHDLLIDFIEPQVKVGAGEVVVTSGVGGGFPAGIPVGNVARSKAVPGDLQRWVTLELSADLGDLSMVKVLKWKPQR
ncbi:MAG: rod shape-determining protein MreC [Acidimicrobiales bacterium]